MSEKTLFRVAAGALATLSILLVNLAIYYSSIPNYEQMGWAIFCGVNAIWILVGGILALIYAESHEVAMRNLDRRQETHA